MAGMNPRDIDQIVALLKQLKHEEAHLSIIAMVEHIMRAVVGLAERVIVMHQGATLVDAPTAEALRDPRVVEVYLGHPKRA
jgi:branched-chain amino acid transport system ATP-binding protein